MGVTPAGSHGSGPELPGNDHRLLTGWVHASVQRVVIPDFNRHLGTPLMTVLIIVMLILENLTNACILLLTSPSNVRIPKLPFVVYCRQVPT
jgi:hypothetical protein